MGSQHFKKYFIGAVAIALMMTAVYFFVRDRNAPGDDDNTGNQQIAVAMTTFSHSDLPGFQYKYPKDWVVNVKEFNANSPDYYSGEVSIFPQYSNLIKNLSSKFMGIRLSKNGVAVQFRFDLSAEDEGTFCFSNPNYTNIDDLWTRIQSSYGYFYTTSAKANELQGEAGMGGTYVDGNIVPESEYLGKEFPLCDHLTGAFLKELATQSTAGEMAGYLGILLKKPQIIGNPDQKLLEEIDTIVSSIRGLK